MGFELSPLSSITVFVEELLIDKLADLWDCQEEDGEDRAYYVYFEWIMAEEDLDPYEFDLVYFCQQTHEVELDLSRISGSFTIYEHKIDGDAEPYKDDDIIVVDKNNNIVNLTFDQSVEISDWMEENLGLGDYSFGVYKKSDWDNLPKNYLETLI